MSDRKEFLSKELLDSVEANADVLEKTVDDVVSDYSSELDEYMKFVRRVVSDDEKPPTDVELDDMALNLSSLIYFTSVGCEQMGIRDDLSRAAYKQAYNVARSLLEKGTVADKNMQAELDAMSEHVVNIVYNKAYKILRAKVDAANEMLASVKKVIGRRQSELETSRMSVYK